MNITVTTIDETIVKLVVNEDGALLANIAKGMDPDEWASLTQGLLMKMHQDYASQLLTQHPEAGLHEAMAHTSAEALMNFALVMLAVGYRYGTADCSAAEVTEETVDDAIARILGGSNG